MLLRVSRRLSIRLSPQNVASDTWRCCLPATFTAVRLQNTLTDAQKEIKPTQKQAEKEIKQAEKLAEKEAKLALKQAEKETKQAEKLAEKEAKLAQKQAEKETKQAEKLAEKEAKLAQKQAEKEIKQAEKLAEKEAKLAQKQAEKKIKQAEQLAKVLTLWEEIIQYSNDVIPVPELLENKVLSILDQPLPKLTPLKFGKENFKESREYFHQFLPYIIADIRSTIDSTLDKIVYKQYKPIKSRLFINMGNRHRIYDTIYIACKIKNLPKLDHYFNNEIICLSSNNSIILGIAAEVDIKTINKLFPKWNLDKNGNYIMNKYKNEKYFKIRIKKNDYELYMNNAISGASNLYNVKIYWHHLCGLTPSERQYNACVDGFKPTFCTQVQNLEAIVWPELTAAVAPVLDIQTDNENSDIDRERIAVRSVKVSPPAPAALLTVQTEQSDSTSEVIVPVPEYTRVLNTQQQNVVAALTSPDAQGIYCLIGPPGTGKTTTTVQLLAERVRKYPTQKILLTGPSNKAVQVVLKQLLENIENPPLVALIGTMRGEIPKHLEEVYAAKYADCLNNILKDAVKIDKNIFKKTENIKIALNKINQRLNRIITSPGLQVYDKYSIIDNLYQYIKKKQEEVCDLHFLIENKDEDKTDEDVVKDYINDIYSRIDSCAFSLECYITQKAQIVFSTLVASGRPGLYKIVQEFDTVFVDEASQALLPETFIPFKYDPELFVLIGDPQQLPGSVSCQSLIQMGYADSLMARLTQGMFAPYVQMLSTQYRMHPSIGKWSSDCFYDRQLAAAAGLEDRVSPLQQLPASMLLRDHPSAFIDVASLEEKGLHGEITNVQEAEAVVATAKYLLDKGIQPEQIGIITFYAAQVKLITEKLRLLEDPPLTAVQDRFTPPLGLTVSTVDGFQGDERDITLISCVRSKEIAGFLRDHRRINVATSRAKHARWIFGNKDGLSRSNTVFKDYFHWTGDDTENNTLPRTQVFSRIELYHSLSAPCTTTTTTTTTTTAAIISTTGSTAATAVSMSRLIENELR